MTPMLTRIAAALAQARTETGWPVLNADPDFNDYPLTREGTDDNDPFTEGDVLALARAALEALLEPTEGMVEAGGDEIFSDILEGMRGANEIATDAFKSMIRAALEEKP